MQVEAQARRRKHAAARYTDLCHGGLREPDHLSQKRLTLSRAPPGAPAIRASIAIFPRPETELVGEREADCLVGQCFHWCSAIERLQGTNAAVLARDGKKMTSSPAPQATALHGSCDDPSLISILGEVVQTLCTGTRNGVAVRGGWLWNSSMASRTVGPSSPGQPLGRGERLSPVAGSPE